MFRARRRQPVGRAGWRERKTRLTSTSVNQGPDRRVRPVAYPPKVALITGAPSKRTSMPLDAPPRSRLQALELVGSGSRSGAAGQWVFEPRLTFWKLDLIRNWPVPMDTIACQAPGAWRRTIAPARAKAAASCAAYARAVPESDLQLHRSGPVRTVRSGHPKPLINRLQRQRGDAFRLGWAYWRKGGATSVRQQSWVRLFESGLKLVGQLKRLCFRSRVCRAILRCAPV